MLILALLSPLAALFTIPTLVAQTNAAQPHSPHPSSPLSQEQLDQALILEGLTLPSPGEFFVAMAKAGRPNWGPVGRIAVTLNSSERCQIALSIGLLLADGYLAVENQNSQDMKNISRDLLEMSKRLNVGENVLARGRSLTDFSENNEWNTLREELEATQNEIKISLTEQKDDPLAFLISLGSWLRTVQAGATLVEAAYAPEPAALLQQAPLVEIYRERLKKLPIRLQEAPLTQLIADVLQKMMPLMQPDETQTALSPAAIHALSVEATRATSRIAGALPPPQPAEPTPQAPASPMETPTP